MPLRRFFYFKRYLLLRFERAESERIVGERDFRKREAYDAKGARGLIAETYTLVAPP